jgi:hypothetical protein
LILLSFAIAWSLLVATNLSGQDFDRQSLKNFTIHKGGGAMRSGDGGEFPMLVDGYVPYHYEETLLCTDCHVMHASMQHNHSGGMGGEGGIPGFPWEGTPTPKLLLAPDPLDLCLLCHDNMAGIPDVVEADVNGLTERSGGFFGQPEVENALGHDLGRDLPSGTGWGYCMRCHWGAPGDNKVTCIDCHAPHGNGNPRNLQWISDPAGTPPMALLVNSAATGLDKYENENISYGTLNSVLLREVPNLCLDCHHIFSGSYTDPDADDIHSRHPTYDSERSDPNHIDDGELRGSSDPAHWEDGTGSGFIGADRVPFVVDGADEFAEGQVVDGSTNGVFCLSCHKVHGSDQPFSMTFSSLGGYNYVGCDQCHYLAQVDE